MNEEIHQDIENRAYELADKYSKHDDSDIQREGFQAYSIGFKAGANFILSKWQEANRWRKVEEELPEESFGTFMAGKYEYTADKFLVKTRNNKYSLASRCRFLGHSAWEWEGSCTFKSSIIEWKPIT